MPDYGHELAFGSFLTPAAADPQRVVALARTSEAAGLDLVTFQDHPYQPAFLDTWTLLTWVAAATERVQVAGNVLNLPLRPPAVLAKAVASLDLLSGGRAVLGLGAGAFWDAIEAMGAPRLSPGDAVQALDEAIDVIRGLWDTDAAGVLRAGGTFHAVTGAKRGPAPAHDVPIWVGAYKPRMLALVGRQADGWLPSLGYLTLTDVPAANARIDEAALAAGRDPREVRRLLNLGSGGFAPSSSGFLQGPVDQWVDELLPLVLEHGFSTFVLGGDDAHTLEVFGQEVAPALREAVAAEREAAGTPGGPVRSVAALAARLPGIAYDHVPAGVRTVEPGDRAYGSVRSTYIWPGSPGLVLQPASTDQVAAALRFARGQDVPLAVRSGGHGIGGKATNDGGVVLDVGRLADVRVLDAERRLVRLGAGARWGDVAAALAPHGLAVSSGDMGDVGVGGLVTAGGHGLLGRSTGLTLDRVRAAEVVLADGTVVRTDDEHDPDLFWAVRGAGSNVGVVTSVDVEAVPLDEVVLAVVTYDAHDPERLVTDWAALVEAAPRELTSFLTLTPGGRSQPIGYAMTVWAGDDTQAAVRAIEPLLAAGPVLQQQAQQLPYAAVVPAHHARHHGQGRPYVRGGLVEHVTPDVAATLAEVLRAGVAPMAQLRAVGGAVNDVPADATAYAHRTQNFSLSAVSDEVSAPRLDALWSGLGGAVTGVYRSFDTSPGRWALTYPPATMARLRGVLAAYDPDRVFAGDLPLD
ncbi:LLM class flavin-dependent oxidoreductase [Cellulomonas palmilytica]|uniref:LLM class flavin-dependent oxidoreductase n=1 Tax=Cellulomonas palmilytica TaxID=2608402 RepID=UPI001F1B65EA|nr:LLM class flavin-dependent oxidoreductase [Cellulomonas palmilytica]UJP38985.1 LLM class flavin-dependent oxidoreductase [Cellulomonas palmilytica]